MTPRVALARISWTQSYITLKYSGKEKYDLDVLHLRNFLKNIEVEDKPPWCGCHDEG
jgi:hypothetical protein